MEQKQKMKAGRRALPPNERRKSYCTRLPQMMIYRLASLPDGVVASRLIESALIKTYPRFFGENN